MSKTVSAIGPKSAPVVIIGEAPDKAAEFQGVPMTGEAMKAQARWLNAVGLRYQSCYVTLVVKRRPEGKIEEMDPAELEQWKALLNFELQQLTGEAPILVPLGNVALEAVTGQKGITNWRGSILKTRLGNGRELRVIPTYAPSWIFKAPEGTKPLMRDWGLIARESKLPDSELPKRQSIIFPTEVDVDHFTREAEGKPYLCVDIETNPTAGEIICVGFSYDPSIGLCIPWEKKWFEPIKVLCGMPMFKVLQNGLYDSFWLRHFGIELMNWQYDTMCMHHQLFPTEPHSLAYMVSMFTRQPYFKSMAKADNEKAVRIGENIEKTYIYNTLDAMTTLEVALELAKLMDVLASVFYRRHYGELLPALLDMMTAGFAVDGAYREHSHENQAKRIQGNREKLAALAGEDLFGEKAISTKKLGKFLYTTLGLPKKYKAPSAKTGKSSLSTDEVQIRTLLNRFPSEFGEAGQLLLDTRRTSQLSTFFADARVDADGRMRSSYRPTTEAARLASSKHPMGGGSNLQQIDREARALFVPDWFED